MYRKKRLPNIAKCKNITSWQDLALYRKEHKIPRYVTVDNEISNKELATDAYNHTAYMSETWKEITTDSTRHSFYRVRNRDDRGGKKFRAFMDKVRQFRNKGIKYPKVIMTQSELLDAALEADDGRRLCIVSPTYHNYICSGYMYGWNNVETRLCSESNLFNVACYRPFSKKWASNRLVRRQKQGAYIDSMFYLTKILFERGDVLKRYDVVLCWPPRSFTFFRRGISVGEIRFMLERRLRYILTVAEEMNVSTLVINDWGCDDYLLNNPVTVANALREALKGIQIERVVLAIPNKEHYRIFKYVFEK